MKKLLIFLVLFMLNATSVFAFTDVGSMSPYYTSVNWLQQNRVVEGYSDGTFKTSNQVNRAEFLVMLYQTVGMTGYDIDLPFSDVPDNEWYTPYVKEAYATGVVNGYSDGTFRPAATINVAEAVKILMNIFFDVTALYKAPSDYVSCQEPPLNEDPYVDDTAWYWRFLQVADSMCIAQGAFAAPGMNGYNPGTELTRGDMAEMLYRSKASSDNANVMYMPEIEPDPIEEGDDDLDDMAVAGTYDAELFAFEYPDGWAVSEDGTYEKGELGWTVMLFPEGSINYSCNCGDCDTEIITLFVNDDAVLNAWMDTYQGEYPNVVSLIEVAGHETTRLEVFDACGSYFYYAILIEDGTYFYLETSAKYYRDNIDEIINTLSF